MLTVKQGLTQTFPKMFLGETLRKSKNVLCILNVNSTAYLKKMYTFKVIKIIQTENYEELLYFFFF